MNNNSKTISGNWINFVEKIQWFRYFNQNLIIISHIFLMLREARQFP